jgi:MoxR-like ATPase
MQEAREGLVRYIEKRVQEKLLEISELQKQIDGRHVAIRTDYLELAEYLK